MASPEWWFDLSRHEVTIEYKEKTKKWFLVVKLKSVKTPHN